MSLNGREKGAWSTSTSTLTGDSQAAFMPLYGRFFAYCEDPENLSRTAIRWRDRNFSYGDLQKRVRQIASSLHGYGVEKGDRIALITSRTFDTVAAVYGILSAGCVVVPVDPQHPTERIRYMSEISECRWLICDNTKQLAKIPDLEATVLDIADMRGERTGAPLQFISEKDLAFVFFTSGSTGLPKGVMVSHGGTANVLNWVVQQFTQQEMAVVLGATSMSFDISIIELFAPLAMGGCLVLVDSILSLLTISPLLDLTLINTVPSALSAVIAARAIPSSVRTVLLSGEALHGGLVNSLYQRGVKNVFNLYGPTEATIFSTVHRVTPDSVDGWMPIGRPLPGVEVCIVDEGLYPVTEGVSGELCVLGLGLAHGYIGRPDLTIERFVKCSSGPHTGRPMYRTGDRVFMRKDGELMYIGRFDDQIKWRGYRIEPNEIACVIGTVSGVARCCVLLKSLSRDGNGSREVLTAYVMPEHRDSSREHLQMAITARVNTTLPTYMRPQYIIFVDALPLTVSGKVDMSRLPTPRDRATANETDFSKSEKTIMPGVEII